MSNPFKGEPAVVSGALIAVFQAAVLLNWINLSADQLAGINVAVVAVLSLFVRQMVKPIYAAKSEGGY